MWWLHYITWIVSIYWVISVFRKKSDFFSLYFSFFSLYLHFFFAHHLLFSILHFHSLERGGNAKKKEKKTWEIREEWTKKIKEEAKILLSLFLMHFFPFILPSHSRPPPVRSLLFLPVRFTYVRSTSGPYYFRSVLISFVFTFFHFSFFSSLFLLILALSSKTFLRTHLFLSLFSTPLYFTLLITNQKRLKQINC